MPSFRLRKSTGGADLRSSSNFALRSLDNLVYTVSLVVEATLISTLQPLPLINRLINNLLNSDFLVSATKTMNRTATLSPAILTSSLRFITLSVINAFAANIKKFTSTAKDITEIFTALVLRRSYKYLNVTSGAMAFTIQRALSLNRSPSVSFTPRIARLAYVTKSLTSSLSSQFSIRVYKTIARTVSFSATLIYVTSRLISLSLQSSFAAVVNKNTYKTIALFMQRYFFAGYISGGSSSTFTFDDSIDASTGSEYVDANPVPTTALSKNARKTLPITQSSLTMLVTPFTKFVQLTVSVVALFSSSFNKSVAKTISLSASYTSRVAKLIYRTINGTSTLTTLIEGLYALMFYQTLEASFSASFNIAKVIQKAISRQVSFSAVIATQSYRFVTLSITNSFNSTILKRTFKALTISGLLTSNASKNIGKSTNLIGTFNPYLSKVITRTLNATLSFLINIQKRTAHYLAIVTSITTIYSKLILKTINRTTTQLVDMTLEAMLARLYEVSLEVMSTFNSLISTRIARYLSAASSLDVLFRKQIAKSLASSFYVNLNLMLQKLNYIRLSLLVSFQPSYSRAVVTTLRVSENFTATAQKLVSRLVSNTALLSITLKKLVSFSINRLTTLTPRIALTVVKQISAITTLSSKISKALTASVLVTISATANWTKLVSVSINKTVSFSISIRRAILISLSLSSSFLVTNVIRVSRLISFALTETFSGSLSKNVATSRSITLTGVSRVTKNVAKFLSAQSSYTTLLFNQSLRFVYLSLVNQFSVNIRKLTYYTVNVSTSLLSNIAKRATRTLAVNSLITATILRTVAASINATTSATLRVSRRTLTTLRASTTSTLSQNSAVSTTLNRAVTFSSNIASRVGRYVSIVLIEAFTGSISKAVQVTKSVSTNASVSFTRAAFKNISVQMQVYALVAFQSLRFVTLSVINQFGVSFRRLTYYGVRATTPINSLFNKTINFSRSTSFNGQARVTQLFSMLLDIDLTALTNFTTIVARTLRASFTASVRLSKALSVSIRATSTQTAYLLAQSSRYVTFAITSSFNSRIAKLVSKTVTVSSLSVATLTKNVRKNLTPSFFITLNLMLQRLNFIRLAVLSSSSLDFNLTVGRRINSSAELISSIQRLTRFSLSATFNAVVAISYAFARTLDVAAALLTNIRRSINANRSVTGSFVASFRKAISTTLSNLLVTFDPSTSFISFRFVSIALTSLLSPTATKRTSRTLSLASSMSNTLSKAITVAINLTVNSSVVLLSQSLRFVSLAISSLFNVSIRKQAATALTVSSSLSANINRLISVSISRTLSLTTFIRKSVTKYLALTTTQAVALTKAVVTTLNATFAFDASVRAVTAFYRTLQASTQSTVNLTKEVSNRLTVSIYSLFDTTVAKNVRRTLSTQFNLTAVISRAVNYALPVTTTLSSMLLFLSYRYVTLQITSAFATVTRKRVYRLISLSFSLTPSISRLVTSTLDVFTDFGASARKLSTRSLNASTTIATAASKSVALSIRLLETYLTRITTRTFLYLRNISTFNVVIVKAVSSSISIALNNLFESQLSKRVATALNAAGSFSALIRRQVAVTLRLSNSWSTLLFTQSQRFVALSILSAQSVFVRVSVNKTINRAITLSSTLFKNVRIYFQTIATSALLSIQRYVAANRAVSTTFAANLRKQVLASVKASVQVVTNFTRVIYVTIRLVASESVRITKATSVNISLATNNLFDAMLNTKPAKQLAVNLSESIAFRRSIATTLSQSLSLTTLVLFQQLRFVNFAITSAFTPSNFGVSVNKSIALVNQIIVRSFKKVVFTAIMASFNTLLDFTNQVFVNRVITSLNSVALVRLPRIFFAITTSGIATIQKSVSRTLAYSLTLATSLSMNVRKALSASLTGFTKLRITIARTFAIASNYAVARTLNVGKSIQLALNLATNLATQSLRFVSLAIANLFTAQRQIQVKSSINYEEYLTIDSANNVRVLLAKSLTINARLTKRVSDALTVNLTAYVNIAAAVAKTLTSTLSLVGTTLTTRSLRFVRLAIINAFTTDNTNSVSITNRIQSAYSTQLNKVVSNALRAGVELISSTSLLISKYLVAPTSFATTLITRSLRFVTLAIISGYSVARKAAVTTTLRVTSASQTVRTAVVDTSLRSSADLVARMSKTSRVTLSTITSGTVSIANSLAVFIRATVTLSTMLAVQSLRFVSLSVVNLFSARTVIRVSIAKGLDSIYWTQLKKNVNNTLRTSVELATSINRVVGKYLVSVISVSATIATRSLRFVTLAIISGYDTLRKSAVSTNLRISYAAQVLRTAVINTTLRLSNGFLTVVAKNARVAIRIASVAAISLTYNVAVFIRTTSTFSTTLITRSLRFVSLAIMNLFEASRTAHVATALRASFVAVNRISKLFERTLTVTSTFFTRRAHTLYSVLTTFAVSKSTPGSEGSGQPTQRQPGGAAQARNIENDGSSAQSTGRKPGGNARKRNTENDGSTLFRRGDTDDLQ